MNPDLSLRYLAHLVGTIGCDPKGTISILYAKAETLRVNSKLKPDKHSSNQKANPLSFPTIIFASTQHLKYFLDHFPNFMSSIYSTCVVGHSFDPLPRGPTVEAFPGNPTTLAAFESELSFERYLSNIQKTKHVGLFLLKKD